jgi:hypothetical protein
VYRWNYSYIDPSPTALLYFGSAIQMKRASYCGDGHAYTISGTQITIQDTEGNWNGPIVNLEAQWSPQGATCLNLNHRRQPTISFPGCAHRSLPPCGDTVPPPGYGWLLANGVNPP